MAKKVSNYNSVFARAWIRDTYTNNIYTEDGMLIAVLAHATGKHRSGMQGKIVRELMHDINERN